MFWGIFNFSSRGNSSPRTSTELRESCWGQRPGCWEKLATSKGGLQPGANGYFQAEMLEINPSWNGRIRLQWGVILLQA